MKYENLLLRGGCCTLRWAGETDERPQIPDLPKGSVIGTTPQPGNSELLAIGEAADHQLHGPEPQLSNHKQCMPCYKLKILLHVNL